MLSMHATAPSTPAVKSRCKAFRVLFLTVLLACSCTAFQPCALFQPARLLKCSRPLHHAIAFNDLIEEVIFSGDPIAFIRKSAPTDTVLSPSFRSYVAEALQKSTDSDERAMLDEISSLIASRLGDDDTNESLMLSDAPTTSSAATDDDDDDVVDWRERMKALQAGEEKDTTGLVVDKLGVFEQKRAVPISTTAAIGGITDQGNEKAVEAAAIIRRQEEEALRAATEAAQVIQKNNKIIQQF